MISNTNRANAFKLLSELFKYPDEGLTKWSPMLVETFSGFSPELGALAESLVKNAEKANTLPDLQVEYSRLFIGPNHLEAPPYSSVYLDEQGLVMGESTHKAIKFYIEAGLNPSDENKEPPDHISTELEFMYYLLFNAVSHADESKLKLAGEFFAQHLSLWANSFAERIANNSEEDFYLILGKLFIEFISFEKNNYQLITL